MPFVSQICKSFRNSGDRRGRDADRLASPLVKRSKSLTTGKFAGDLGFYQFVEDRQAESSRAGHSSASEKCPIDLRLRIQESKVRPGILLHRAGFVQRRIQLP